MLTTTGRRKHPLRIVQTRACPAEHHNSYGVRTELFGPAGFYTATQRRAIGKLKLERPTK